MRIGVTGHRPNRLHIGEAAVTARLYEVLAALLEGARAKRPEAQAIAVTSLAEGTDCLFATEALGLGYAMHAIVPFASADYETTFGDGAAVPPYQALLARAANVVELPGALSDATAAYEAAGRAMVEASDLIVTVWDGKPAAGRGGTPEIIAYALATKDPVIWIDAKSDRAPMRLSALAPKRRAATVTADEISKLGARYAAK